MDEWSRWMSGVGGWVRCLGLICSRQPLTRVSMCRSSSPLRPTPSPLRSLLLASTTVGRLHWVRSSSSFFHLFVKEWKNNQKVCLNFKRTQLKLVIWVLARISPVRRTTQISKGFQIAWWVQMLWQCKTELRICCYHANFHFLVNKCLNLDEMTAGSLPSSIFLILGGGS